MWPELEFGARWRQLREIGLHYYAKRLHICNNALRGTCVYNLKGLTFKYCSRASNSAFLIESLYTVSNLNIGNKQFCQIVLYCKH